jgi:hypothetical protein
MAMLWYVFDLTPNILKPSTQKVPPMFDLIVFYALFISVYDPECAKHTDIVVKEGATTFKVHKEGASAEIVINMADYQISTEDLGLKSTEVLRLKLVHDEIELTSQEKGQTVTTKIPGAKLEKTLKLAKPIDYEKNEITTGDGTVTRYTISGEVIEFSVP